MGSAAEEVARVLEDRGLPLVAIVNNAGNPLPVAPRPPHPWRCRAACARTAHSDVGHGRNQPRPAPALAGVSGTPLPLELETVANIQFVLDVNVLGIVVRRRRRCRRRPNRCARPHRHICRGHGPAAGRLPGCGGRHPRR